MTHLSFVDGCYSAPHLLATIAGVTPRLLPDWRRVISNLSGPDKIPGPLGVVLYLRMAQLMGCPVCRALFPLMARSKGLSEAQIREALGGPAGYLDPQLQHAATYAEAVLRADGGAVAAPRELSATRCEQVRTFVRVSMLIHSIGLMFLPHSLIEHARSGRPSRLALAEATACGGCAGSFAGWSAGCWPCSCWSGG